MFEEDEEAEDASAMAATSYSEGEIESLAKEVELEQPVAPPADGGRMSATIIAVIAAAGVGLVALAIVDIFIIRKRKINR